MRKLSLNKNKSRDEIRKTNRKIILCFLLLMGFLIRVFFADKFIKESGDLRLYADWGEKFWQYGSKEFYYQKDWYYAPPNYPPIISLLYAGSYWLYDHKYILPQIHNATRLITSFFIVYFYKSGNYLLLKLPAILADVCLAYLIYKVVLRLTENQDRALMASVFYLFNPVSIFLRGIWGQTDSLIALFGLLSMMTIWRGNFLISLPFLFTSLFIKPNWGIFIFLYIFLVFIKRPALKQVFVGILISLVIFWVTTSIFARGSVFTFSEYLLRTRFLPTAIVAHKASVSAFNLHALFYEIDKTSDKVSYLGIHVDILGITLYLIINLYSFYYLHRQKYSLNSLMTILFVIGFSSYLFLTNMLERYFFPAFIPMIIVAFSKPKVFVYMILITIATFLNILYSFFRRSMGEIADIFTQGNFLVVRIISLTSLLSWCVILKKVKYLAS